MPLGCAGCLVLVTWVPQRKKMVKLLKVKQTGGIKEYLRYYKQLVMEAGEELEAPANIFRFWSGRKDKE